MLSSVDGTVGLGKNGVSEVEDALEEVVAISTGVVERLVVGVPPPVLSLPALDVDVVGDPETPLLVVVGACRATWTRGAAV